MQWCDMSLNMNLEIEELLETHGLGIRTGFYWAPIGSNPVISDGGLLLDPDKEDNSDNDPIGLIS